MAKKILTGKIVSIKMQKAVVVAVDMPKVHKIYRKTIKNTRRFKARDEIGTAVGDLVRIQESKPISKEIRWNVIEIVEKGLPAQSGEK